jgi:hypothetical protein
MFWRLLLLEKVSKRIICAAVVTYAVQLRAIPADLLHLLDVVTALDGVAEVGTEILDFLFLLQLLLFGSRLLLLLSGRGDGEQGGEYDEKLHGVGVLLLEGGLVWSAEEKLRRERCALRW